MDKESDRASVGQSSQGSGITFSPAVELAFERGLAEAKVRSAAVLTTEYVLIELLDEKTVSELLSSASVDIDALRADLKEYSGSGTENAVTGDEPKPDPPLQNAMRRAVLKALTSNEKGASGADIIVAILVEGDSYSAEMLRKYGLSVDSAENVYLERYLQRSKEQTERLAEMQEKARSQRERTAGRVSRNTQATEPRLHSKTKEGGTLQSEYDSGHKVYILRIVSDDDEVGHVAFKAALSRNGILDLYVEETPFEIQFVAGTVVGLFESVEGGDRLKVQLTTDMDGKQRTVSGFSGSAGAIFNDRPSPLGRRSGFLD